MSGNGSHGQLPRSVNIQKREDIPSIEQMIGEMWVDMKMMKIRLYGDSEMKVKGVADEIGDIRSDIKAVNEKIDPLLEDRRLRKIIVRGLITLFTALGLGKWITDYLHR